MYLHLCGELISMKSLFAMQNCKELKKENLLL
jgi:hypothetical protein